MDAARWDERYAATDLLWSAEPNRFVAENLADLPPGRALDLAAGEGRNAIWLARRGWDVTAADFSQVALDRGRRIAGETTVRWVCADATRWDERPAQRPPHRPPPTMQQRRHPRRFVLSPTRGQPTAPGLQFVVLSRWSTRRSR